eukprot:8670184-Ditylum_brightwellii.AAC.1
MMTPFMTLKGKLTMSSTKSVTDTMGGILMGNLYANFYPQRRRHGLEVAEMKMINIALGMARMTHILCIAFQLPLADT